jgi:hypothetical protein
MDVACSSQFLSCSFNSASKPSQIDENDMQKHHKNTHICSSIFLGEMIRLGLERRPPSQCRAGLGPVRRNAGLRECRAGPGRPSVMDPSSVPGRAPSSVCDGPELRHRRRDVVNLYIRLGVVRGSAKNLHHCIF